ncbi:MAG TPA: sulfatase-like hydrolase/transferase, partial [Candidatus Omnitrophota bacterium]|nr:sulfatase-like hydrolase/transferase [Candidatus Omnitrophota bacterium]
PGKFFLYLHYFGVHYPYAPSEPYFSDFIKDDLNETDKTIRIAEDKNAIFDRIFKEVSDNGITSFNHYACSYDGKLRIVDGQIGRLLEGIKAEGLDKNTIIIFTSDHGEGFGEHHLYFQHSYTVFEELIRVPFIAKFPWMKPGIRREQVGLIDIGPSILDALNISDKGLFQGKNVIDLEGKDLHLSSRAIYGMSLSGIMHYARMEGKKVIFFDFSKLDKQVPGFRWPDFMPDDVKSGLVTSLYLFYDLDKDVRESVSLSEGIDGFRTLRSKIGDFVSSSGPKMDKCFIDAQNYLSLKPAKTQDEKIIKKLRSLGYVQ